MNKILSAFFFIGGAIVLNAQGIVFEKGTFAEAKAKAKAEHKLIFMDAFTVWCGPCKQLSKTIFPLQEVGDYFNQNFINVKMDMEKGEGIELAKAYAVNAYPTLIFLNANGELVHRTCGLMPKESLIEEAKNAVGGINTFVAAQKTKNKIIGNSTEALKYFQMMDNACARFEKDLELFFSNFSPLQMNEEATDKIFADYVTSTNSKGFEYVVVHQTEMTNKWGTDKYNKFISTSILNDINRLGTNKTQANAINEKINKYAAVNDKAYLQALLKVVLADVNKNMDEYAPAVVAYVNQFALNDANQLNNYAWSFYEKIEQKQYLLEAEKWAELACTMQKADWHALDTYAAVLYKLKKKDQAAVEAQKAISLGKRLGDDMSDTEALLQKINQLP
jgi:thioredoxin-related protein